MLLHLYIYITVMQHIFLRYATVHRSR